MKTAKDSMKQPLLLRGLSPLMTRKESLGWFVATPAMPDSVSQLSDEERVVALSGLKEMQCPRSEYADLYLAAESAMRHSYGLRDPETSQGRRGLYEALPTLDIKANCPLGSRSNRYDGSNILVTGGSGCGKTRWALRMAERHPECIDLGAMTDGRVPHLQVPVLYIRCPGESTTQGMVSGFLDSLEDVTAERRLISSFRRAKYSTSEGARVIAQLCRTFFIGLIIWDEFQDLVEANRRGTRLMNNFLKYVRDRAGVPMTYVGNYSMWEAFSEDVPLMRRSTTGGVGWIDRFEDPQDKNWAAMVSMYWQFQVVRKPIELTLAIRNHIYDRTQGMPDFLRALIEQSQILAIRNRRETMDHETIEEAYQKAVALHGPVEALKSNDPALLLAYKGLLNPLTIAQAERAIGQNKTARAKKPAKAKQEVFA